MAKKQKNDAPDTLSVTNRDILQRLNFLYQASVYLQGLPGTSAAPSSPPDAGDNPRKEVKTTGKSNLDLSRTYVEMMRVVGKRAVVRMDPGIKRTICKKCNAVLVAGSTATVRMKSSKSHRHIITYTCTLCGASRRIPAPPLSVKSDIAAPSEAAAAPGDLKSTTMSNEIGKKTFPERLPPLSSLLDAGHVVFRGQEKLVIDDEKGTGSFMA